MCNEIALIPLTEAELAEYLAVDAPAAAAPESLAALIYRMAKALHYSCWPFWFTCETGLIALENRTWQIKVAIERI